ncbi:MAG: discoidin domain-containing protein, partial [Gemmatimonadota bacterium]|nr:discoidin domain-containing protein [Gemmatimonadota bacterium]
MSRTRIAVLALAAIGTLGAAPAAKQIVVTIDDRRPLRSFDPRVALGSTIDGHVRGSTDRIFTTANIAAMRSANFGPISYRLRTELGIEAWHWNARGHWSDSARSQGYWISDDRPGEPIHISYGFRLPRRGSTTDQANNVGYSRLDDGDTTSFWKSNPYLDEHFTGEPNAKHPQWAVIDLGARRPLGVMRVLWGKPYAVRYEVQYWAGEDPNDFDEDSDDGVWRAFPHGRVESGRGGDVTLRLSDAPIRARFVRLLLSERSRPDVASRDARDDLGFAIRELYLGLMVGGRLRDELRHGTERGTGENSQTRMTVSSTDPWHRAIDKMADTEQPGIDLVIESGVTKGLPLLAPAGVLYDTPENAAALLRYLRAKHYPVERIELGEEPDGQYVPPDDFAALYLQVATALHAVDPTVALGGPSFQSTVTDVMMTWKSRVDEAPWLTHFVHYLRERNRLGDFRFFSFEWYPFDDVCVPTQPQIAVVSRTLQGAIAKFRDDGLPADVPIVLGEYGYSAFATRSQVDRAGALLNAETIGTFLAAGGGAAFLYGTEPAPLEVDPVRGA